jgi:hypothetical protein
MPVAKGFAYSIVLSALVCSVFTGAFASSMNLGLFILLCHASNVTVQVARGMRLAARVAHRASDARIACLVRNVILSHQS